MSICANTVQSNQQSFFFALAGSGGGGSTIQSPASVVPDASVGNALFSVGALAGSNGSGQIGLLGEGTGVGAIVIGAGNQLPFRIQAETVGALPGDNVLNITGNAESTPAFSYNETTHTVALGDANASGLVVTNNSVSIQDPAGGANSIILAPSNATTSGIFQGVASGGVLGIGSSLAKPDNILTFDVAGVSKTVIQGNTGNGICLTGGVGSGSPTIFTNVGDTGSLQLGSSALSPDNITMTDGGIVGTGRTVVKNLAPPSLSNNICSIGGQKVSIPVGVNTITLPVGVTPTPGLWYFAVNITSGGNEQFQASCIVYYSGTQWSSGGSTQSAQDGNGKYVQLYSSGANMTIAFNGGASVPGYVVVTPLFNASIIGFG